MAMGSCCQCSKQMRRNLQQVLRLATNKSIQRSAIPYVARQFFSANAGSASSVEAAQLEDVTRLFNEVKLKVRGNDESVLDSYTQFVQRAAMTLNLDISGKIIIPMHIERRTLLKSPHVYKTHRYQYELRTHARMLQLRQLTGDTADIFLEYIQRNIPEGVSMSIEQTELETLPDYLTRTEMDA